MLTSRYRLLIFVALLCTSPAVSGTGDAPPDILFIVIDDTGVDQWANFGWDSGGLQRAPVTPVLDAITSDGVAFTNCWAMPECSPSRASFFTGRLPMRTGIDAAITTAHLPASQLNPSEIMTPKVLKEAGYRCGFSGKWHTGEVPFEERQPIAMHWDWYDGNWLGWVPGIDTTGAGQLSSAAPDADAYPNGWLPCGGPLGNSNNTGPCCLNAGTCWEDVWGPDCMALGGVPLMALQDDGMGGQQPVLASDCGDGCNEIIFTEDADGNNAWNGFMVWNRQWADATSGSFGLNEYYHGSMLTRTTDTAIDWLEEVDPIDAPSEDPWYLALQYNTAHDPVMPTSPDMVARMEADGIDTATLDCLSGTGIKTVFPYMIEEADTEIGRLLEARGLGQYESDGSFTLGDLESANTVIAWIGDNGTFYSSTRSPFNPLLSKATVYQTGVWVPMAVAGAGVSAGSVDHPVNAVDLFELFVELAGLDLAAVVPDSHILDSKSLMPYLSDPSHESIRAFNLAQNGKGVLNPFNPPQACLLDIAGVLLCDDIHFSGAGLCESNGGVWYGADPSSDDYPVTCCDYMNDINSTVSPQPDRQYAIAMPDDSSESYHLWKIIVRQEAWCVEDADGYSCLDSLEFYRLPTPVPPHIPGLDNPSGVNQIALPAVPADLSSTLTATEYAAFMALACELKREWASADTCKADINIDGRVGVVDLLAVLEAWSGQNEQVSFSDIDGPNDLPDGKVNLRDLLPVLTNWSGSSSCVKDDVYPGADCLFDYAIDCQ